MEKPEKKALGTRIYAVMRRIRFGPNTSTFIPFWPLNGVNSPGYARRIFPLFFHLCANVSKKGKDLVEYEEKKKKRKKKRKRRRNAPVKVNQITFFLSIDFPQSFQTL